MSPDHVANALGQPIGRPLAGWTPPPFPPREAIDGRYCRLEPLDPAAHARGLWEAGALDREGRNWTYLTHGPYGTFEAYLEWVETAAAQRDPQFFAVVGKPSDSRRPTPDSRPSTSLGAALSLSKGRTPVGVLSLMRIDPPNGVIEVGGINFSPLLQRTPAATEAIYLVMDRVFELGYRRFEWKCDALNAPSRRSAQRFGFSYEGIFRQVLVTKGRSRDTAWYACIDREWPALRAAYQRWLTPENFDADGRQKLSLADLTAPILVARG